MFGKDLICVYYLRWLEFNPVGLMLWFFFWQIEMAQKLLNSDLAELIGKMKLAQQYVMTRWVHTLQHQLHYM